MIALCIAVIVFALVFNFLIATALTIFVMGFKRKETKPSEVYNIKKFTKHY